MRTSKLIIELVNSLAHNGDLPTNINDIAWLCTSEGGNFEQVILSSTKDEENEN